MKSELQMFRNSEFGDLGVLEVNGKPYFPATACAKILGHENPSRAIRKFCKGVTELVTPTNGGSQTMRFIPEGDLYRLIVNSRLPAAERFERWVFDEVLPAIRKTGSYGQSNAQGFSMEQMVKFATEVATQVTLQIVPLIIPVIADAMRETKGVAERAEEDEICTTTIIMEKGRRKRRNILGKIEQLPQDVQLEVAQMLKRNAIYGEVAEYLARLGHEVSQMAVSRYYNKKIV